MYSPLGQFTSAIIHHITLCRSSCSQQKAFLERLVIFFTSAILVTLKGKYLPSFLCLKNDSESVVSSTKKNKGFKIVKCQRRQSSCWIVQFAKFLKMLCSCWWFSWNNVFSAYSFQSHQSFFPHGHQGCISPQTTHRLEAGLLVKPPGAVPGYRLYNGCLPHFFFLVILYVQWKSAAMNESNRCWCPGAGNSFTSLLSGLPGTRLRGTVPHRCPPSQRHLLLFRGNPVTPH